MSTHNISKLTAVMAQLRTPVTGCPWDLEQDFKSIAPYTIEEAYEVADAIDRNDMAGLKDELGDLLLQVVFHSRMAEEAGHFDLGDVIETICSKMTHRHPHVFAEQRVNDAATVITNWETIKAEERSRSSSDHSALAGVALGHPALLRAQKLQKRAARTGFDWPATDGVFAKIHEEIDELAAADMPDHQEEEIGDLMFAVVNLCRHLSIDAETALKNANGKFERRFRAMEDMVGSEFAVMPLSEKEKLWNEVKILERQSQDKN